MTAHQSGGWVEDRVVIEREANAFAFALLMPRDMLRADVNKMGGIDMHDTKAVRALATRYQVDPFVMAFRLGMLFGQSIGRNAP